MGINVSRDLLLKIVQLMGIVLLVMFFYAFVHEGSHALVAMLFGGKVTSFEVNFLVTSPRMSYTGVSDPVQQGLISLAGPVLPLLLVVPFAMLLPRVGNKAIQGCILLSLVILLGTLIGSVCISIVYGLGAISYSEDLHKFISATGVNAFILAGILTLVLVAAIYLALRIGRVGQTYLNLLQAIQGADERVKQPVWIKVLAILVLVVGLANIVRNVTSPVQFHEPTSYKSKFTVDFGAEPAVSQFYSFTLTEPTTYDFIYSLETRSEVDLSLVNLNGEPFPFNNQDRITMYQGSESLGQAYFTGFTFLEGDYALEAVTRGQTSITMYVDTKVPQEIEQQYLALLTQVNAGNFVADSYQEPGYQLIFQDEIQPGADQIILSLLGSSNQRMVSAFVVGDYDTVTLEYIVDGNSRVILHDFNATMGYGLPVSRNQGEFRLTAVEPDAKLYIYVK